MKPVLLIDGRNIAYRAVFAAREKIKNGLHPFVVWMRFMHVWVETFDPSAIHVFWDCKKNDVWRKAIYNEYKDHRDHILDRYDDFDVAGSISRLEQSAKSILPYIGPGS